MHALLDGDVLLYKSGFASDANAKREYIDRFGDAEGYDPKEHHEPLANALQMTKQTLNGILDAVRAKEYTVVISHPVNYREGFFPDYKMNRDITHKPYWYKEIGEYLFQHHGAVYSEQGDEADDMLGILQMEALVNDEQTVICSIDKDLQGVPGLHYNFSPKNIERGVFEVSPVEASRNFYRQILTGDTSDNIPGMYKKLGIKASKKYLSPLESMTRDPEMERYVRDIYKDDRFVDVMGTLLYIKREPGRWWKDLPPGGYVM